MFKCYAARNGLQVWRILLQGLEQPGDGRFTFAGQDAIHGAGGVLQDFFGNKRNTVAANADKGARHQVARSAGEIDDFRKVCEIIAAERDRVRLPALEQPEKILMGFALQVDQPHRVAGLSRGRGDKLQTERFETKINLRVHEAAGMNGEEFHLFSKAIGPFDSSGAIAPGKANQ